ARMTPSPTRWPTPARWPTNRWPRCSCACWRCRSRASACTRCSTCSPAPRWPRPTAWMRRRSSACRPGSAPLARAGASMPRTAPAAVAYTRAFAPARLLVGHASGSDAPIGAAAGRLVAALPDLEGGALDALDPLVRLRRVLARHARLLGEAMPPAQWRERLLELLEAVLPRPPATPAGQRALARPCRLVDEFAGSAREAGLDTPWSASDVSSTLASVTS